MAESELQSLVRRLHGFSAEAGELERLVRVVESSGERVQAFAQDDLGFDDDPGSFSLALARAKSDD